MALLGAAGHAYWTAAIAAAACLAWRRWSRPLDTGSGRAAGGPAPAGRAAKVGWRPTASFQIAIYLVQEVLERLEVGIPAAALLNGRLLVVGVAVQVGYRRRRGGAAHGGRPCRRGRRSGTPPAGCPAPVRPAAGWTWWLAGRAGCWRPAWAAAPRLCSFVADPTARPAAAMEDATCSTFRGATMRTRILAATVAATLAALLDPPARRPRRRPRGEDGRQVPPRGRLRRRARLRRREEQRPADPGRRRRQAGHRPHQHPQGRGHHRRRRAAGAADGALLRGRRVRHPGRLPGFFIPTAPGSYSFHLTGTIKGQKIDQTFKSGPESFSDIEDPAQVQYPVKQPTGAQLATRADRDTARIDAALAAERDQARDDASSARTLAIVGLIVGVLGLAGRWYRTRRQPAQPGPGRLGPGRHHRAARRPTVGSFSRKKKIFFFFFKKKKKKKTTLACNPPGRQGAPWWT